MLDIDIKSITENYRERIQRLALFDPLYKLSNKNSRDRSNKPIDYFNLGFLALLFFFENMLMRNKKTGIRELAEFFQKINQGRLDLDYEDFEKIARNIIEIFRPPNGKRNSRKFYNWETGKEETVQYSIIKAERANFEKNTQYYTLDEQGLELVFATKEYFNEFQLSINQLVLRKQLEKGEFVGALRQIDEMSLGVRNLRDRIMRIKHEVSRNIISNQIYERYKNIIEDINIRLQREDEEFSELQSFVKETKEKMGNEIVHEKDRKAYELIIKVDRELGQVNYEHRLLLKESIILKTRALESAQEALYYSGIDSFNFDQEITGRLFSSPLPLHASRMLIEPFMFLKRYKGWSPLAVFFRQRIENRSSLKKFQDFLSVSDKEEVEEDIEIQANNFREITSIVLGALGDRKDIDLKQVVVYMKRSGYENILDRRCFYDYWILLHQKSPVNLGNYENSGKSLFGKSFGLFAQKSDCICVKEIGGVLEVTKRFTIKDMNLRLE